MDIYGYALQWLKSNTEHLKRYGSASCLDSFSSTHTHSHYVISSSLHHRLCAVLWTQWLRKRAPFLPQSNRHYILGIIQYRLIQNEWLAFKPVCSALCTLPSIKTNRWCVCFSCWSVSAGFEQLSTKRWITFIQACLKRPTAAITAHSVLTKTNLDKLVVNCSWVCDIKSHDQGKRRGRGWER